MAKIKNPTAILYVGPMYSGKSKALIEFSKHLETNNLLYRCYKPLLDSRDMSIIKSRDSEMRLPAIGVANSKHLLRDLKDFLSQGNYLTHVLIDEIMLLDEHVVGIVDFCKVHKINVVAAGLFYNFRGVPFLLQQSTQKVPHAFTMKDLIEEFDTVEWFTAKCTRCGKEARYTQRMTYGIPSSLHEPQVVIDDGSSYEARCDKHHQLTGVKNGKSNVGTIKRV